MKQPSSNRWLLPILIPLILGGAVAYWLLTRTPAKALPLPVLGALPSFALTDQNGKEMGLPQLLGKTWVASFIFTRCGATCPAQMKNGRELQEQLKKLTLNNYVRMVFFSVNPEHDTVSVLNDYGNLHGADPEFWHLVTGSADDIVSLSREGFKLPAGRAGTTEDPTGFPTHSAKFVLVDASGQIRGYYDGDDSQSLETLAADVERVMDDSAPQITPLAEAQAMRDTEQKLDVVLRDTSWLRKRHRDQIVQSRNVKSFHAFKFTDRLYESGITFRNRAVDDAVNDYKSVHYDHGTGISIADVDGDSRYDILFVNQVGANQLYRNLGNGQFEDITATAGVGLPQPIKVSATFADFNNDGNPDLYVTTVRGGNHLLINDGQGQFTDRTEGSGLGLNGHYATPVVFDYDRDGWLDVFLCDVGVFTSEKLRTVSNQDLGIAETDPNSYQYYEGFADAFSGHLMPERSGKCLLLRNLGDGTFTDVTDAVGLAHQGWSGDATPIDANRDGWPDLYVLNMQGSDQYYENREGKEFVRRTADLFPKTSWGAMGVKVFDFDNDEQLDMMITDMHSDMSAIIPPDRTEERKKSNMLWPEDFLQTAESSIFGNSLFKSVGPDQFVESSDVVGAENFWPWGLSVGDLNADGFQDAFITAGMSFPFRYGINSLLLNENGEQFADCEFILGVEPRRGWATAMPWFRHLGTFADGRPPELVTVWSSLSSRSSAMFDVDDDGDLDIVTLEFNTKPLLLISNLSEKKPVHFVKIKLVGGSPAAGAAPMNLGQSISNRDGLGAVVKVRCGDQTFTQVHDGKSGYLSQSSLPLYFGLDDANQVDSIEVTWPSGQVTTQGPVAANQMITIRESQ